MILAGVLSANSAYGIWHMDKYRCPDHYSGSVHNSFAGPARPALQNWGLSTSLQPVG